MTEKKPIKIKPENKGKFNSYCKSKGFNSVTRECEEERLVSKLAGVRKQANFARNARSWNK